MIEGIFQNQSIAFAIVSDGVVIVDPFTYASMSFLFSSDDMSRLAEETGE